MNWRFMLFLLIFSGYWIVFWQQYLILPIYIHDYVSTTVDTELTLVADPLIVILFTMAISLLTQKMRAFSAVILGTLVSAVAWLVVIALPKSAMFFHVGSSEIWGTAVLALVVCALGELIQQPRYYDYISRLAPPGQQGTYMGFAFLPIGVGSLVGGRVAGALLHHYGEVRHQPQMIWWCVTAVGVGTTLLLWIYDKTLRPKSADELPTIAS
jgi:dipeptide/tripeptide permease